MRILDTNQNPKKRRGKRQEKMTSVLTPPQQLDLFDQPISSKLDRLTFNQALRLFEEVYWNKKKMSERTKSSIRYLNSFFNGRNLEEIGRYDIENLRMHLSRNVYNQRTNTRGLGVSAVNKAHMIITLLYNKFEQWKQDGWAGGYNFENLVLPRKNPGLLVKKAMEPQDDRFFTPWEFRIWIRLAKQIGDYRLADIIRFGIWLRLSPIDLREFNDDEIDEQNMVIRVYRRHTKTDKNPQGCLQVIPITERIWGRIQTCRRYRDPKENRILDFRNDRRRLAKLRKAFRALGYRDFTWRHLRRSGSGHLFTKGVDFQTIADGQGHKDPRTTRRYYTPLVNPNLRKATQVLLSEFDA